MINLAQGQKRTTKKKRKKESNIYEKVYALYKGRELNLNAFKSGIFPIKSTQGKGRPLVLAKRLKILTTKTNASITTNSSCTSKIR